MATRLECTSCRTEVTGAFALGRLAALEEPHASLLEMFLRVRGNVKEMERELGLSYPTVRARLDEAFEAAGYGRAAERRGPADADWPIPDLEERIQARIEERMAEVEQRLAGSFNRLPQAREEDLARRRKEILDRLEAGEIGPDEAAARLHRLKDRRFS